MSKFKKILAATILAATLIPTASFAVFGDGALIEEDMVGNGCIAGSGEYASTTFTISGSADTWIKNHGVVNTGDTLSHNVVLDFNAAGLTIPPACDGVIVDVVVTANNADFANTESNLALDAVTVAGDGTKTLNNMDPIDIKLDMTATSSSGDLAEEFTYSFPVTISIKAQAGQ